LLLTLDAHPIRMQNACMSKHIQIRDVDAKVHKKLVQRAGDQGLSLTEYLRKELAELAHRPSSTEVFKRLRTLRPAKPGPSGADMIREDRDLR
jgi:antitoxin FitA